jgi:hypothetical protein
VSWRGKHPLLTGHIRREPLIEIMYNNVQKCTDLILVHSSSSWLTPTAQNEEPQVHIVDDLQILDVKSLFKKWLID